MNKSNTLFIGVIIGGTILYVYAFNFQYNDDKDFCNRLYAHDGQKEKEACYPRHQIPTIIGFTFIALLFATGSLVGYKILNALSKP